MNAFHNVYQDPERARAYAGLEFPGTYYLAFRDIPSLLEKHVTGTRALDFGCGAGRSTRFLREQGFAVVGVDVSAEMLREAAGRDPDIEYLLLPPNDLSALRGREFDLILCAFTFDNVPGAERRANLFRQLGQRLSPGGRILNLVSSAEIYVNEWLSFSTRDFPENRTARPGDVVRVTMLDVPDRRPVEDVFWTERDYLEAYAAAGLQVLDTHRPLGQTDEPFAWVTELTIAPWTTHILSRLPAHDRRSMTRERPQPAARR